MSAIDRLFLIAVAVILAVVIHLLGELRETLAEMFGRLSTLDDRLTQLDLTTTSHGAEIRHLSRAVYEGDFP